MSNKIGYKVATAIAAVITIFSLSASLYFFHIGQLESSWMFLYPTVVGVITLMFLFSRKKAILANDEEKTEVKV